MTTLSQAGVLKLSNDEAQHEMLGKEIRQRELRRSRLIRSSQEAGANIDFGDEGAVDWAFLGNLKKLRPLLVA
jgi:hypothetical protein